MNRSHIHWPCLSLSEAFWFQEGPGVRKWQFTNSGIKLLNVGNIEKEGTLNLAKTDRHLSEEEVANKYSHFLVDAGDLVIASSGISFDDDGFLRTRGAFVEKHQLPLCLNTSTIRFKAIEGVSDLCFLRFWLNGHEFRSQITKLVTGTAQQNFGPSHLKAIKITLPPLKEQRRIADVLIRAEELRSKRREAIAQLNTLTQAIFLEMFGDPATNPKRWTVKSVGELASKFSDGPFGSNLKTSHYTEVGIRVIRLQNIGIGEFLDKDKAYISSEHFAKLKKHECHPGDVLIGTLGDPNLRACIQPDSLSLALNKADCVQLRANQEISHPAYICALLNQPAVERMAQEFIVGQTRLRISMGRLRMLKVPLPPLPLQQEFACRVEAVEKLKAAHRASLSELDALFTSLQHRAFRGEL